MTPVLTEQQLQAIHDANDAGPVTVVDSATSTRYVLVRADVFEEMQHWLRDLSPQDAYHFVDEVMADDDANDPSLASYQNDTAEPT
jgi:hypothetical protein